MFLYYVLIKYISSVFLFLLIIFFLIHRDCYIQLYLHHLHFGKIIFCVRVQNTLKYIFLSWYLTNIYHILVISSVLLYSNIIAKHFPLRKETFFSQSFVNYYYFCCCNLCFTVVLNRCW